MQTTGLGQVQARFRAYQVGTLGACVDASQVTAEAVAAYDKQNHRWQNRTGQAEATIHCDVVAGLTRVRLVNAHGQPYGRLLETMQQGRFAILLEALRANGAAWVAGMAGRMRALR